MANYSVQQQPVDTLLSWIKSNEIAIPEIQRPFVWTSTKVRDLIDSLYNGYPVGYIITWKNPNVKTKDGKLSEGRKVLIDGQQRITALTAAIIGQHVLNKYYQKERIKIAFHPIEKRFEVLNTAIEKDVAWIKDIGPVVNNKLKITQVIRDYKGNNEYADEAQIEESIEELKSILNKPIGIIELSANLDIETVTEIFIRINREGVVLSQADFVMSKIAADEKYQGNLLRKFIEYFCHLYVDGEFLTHIKENDRDFSSNDFFRKLSWIAKSEDEIYTPQYQDVLRVAYAYKFNRAKFSDLVNLLSGRNFEKRTYEEEIAAASYVLLKEGVEGFISQTNFERFMMMINSIGFISNWFIISKFALNFAYTLYLKLKDTGHSASDIEFYVKKWYVLSLLTSRYSGSAETAFDYDIKQINSIGIKQFLTDVEAANLSDAFWNARVLQDLSTSNVKNPVFVVYLAQQISRNQKGFLSKDITVRDMVIHRGDLHHLFPKELLRLKGYNRSQYNQVANFVYAQQEINIKIGKKSPDKYFDVINQQIEKGQAKLGNILDKKTLDKNLKENAIPSSLINATVEHYYDVLNERKQLMSNAIRYYYENL
jgi:hypothetical protein